MQTITVEEAKQNLDTLITQIIADSEPTFVRAENGAQVVMISVAEFNAWQETAYLLSSPANAEHLRRSIAEAKAGKATEQDLLEP